MPVSEPEKKAEKTTHTIRMVKSKLSEAVPTGVATINRN